MMSIRQLFIFIIIYAASLLHVDGAEPIAVKGIIDLRQVIDNEQFIVKLNGEWEFYWNKMLHPYDFASGKITPVYYGKVPSYWTDYSGTK